MHVFCFVFFLNEVFSDDHWKTNDHKKRVNLLPCDLIPGWESRLKTWGTSTFAASPGLQTVFALSAEWKTESRCGCCWRRPLLLFDGVLLWWRHGAERQGWDCTTVGLYLIYLPPRLPAFTDEYNQVLLMLRAETLLSSLLLLLLYYCIDLSIFASVNRSEKWEDPASSHVSLYHDLICTPKIHFLDMVCLHHFISCQLFLWLPMKRQLKQDEFWWSRWSAEPAQLNESHKYNRLDN